MYEVASVGSVSELNTKEKASKTPEFIPLWSQTIEAMWPDALGSYYHTSTSKLYSQTTTQINLAPSLSCPFHINGKISNTSLRFKSRLFVLKTKAMKTEVLGKMLIQYPSLLSLDVWELRYWNSQDLTIMTAWLDCMSGVFMLKDHSV